MADPILAGISRGLQQLPVNDANRPVIRREPEGFRPGPVQPAGAGIRPAPGARRAALAPAATDLPMRRMAQPAAGAAVRAPEPPPIPQRLADLMRQETGRAQIAAAERPAVPGSGDSRGSERTDRVVPEPGLMAPAFAPAATEPVHATLKPSAVVEGDWVTLGDVVEFGDADGARVESLRGLRLWRAPMPGTERVVASEDVAKRARNAGVPEGMVLEGAPDVRITAAATALSGEKLVDYARKELEAGTDIPGATVAIENPKAPAPITVRGTDVTLRAEVSAGKPWASLPASSLPPRWPPGC